MTYARARLWLGISGVGSLVLLASTALVFGLPDVMLNDGQLFSWSDVGQIVVLSLAVNLWMMPFDYLGGYRLPRKFKKTSKSFAQWVSTYGAAVIGQSSLFVAFAVAILTAGRALGLLGSLLAICGGLFVCLFIRKHLLLNRRIDCDWSSNKFVDALSMVQSWDVFVPKTMIVEHSDVGFTGGIIGLGNKARIVVPEAWLKEMTKEQLATAIARRATAITSGSYSRGLVLAFLWNAIGFVLCCSMPNSGPTSVAALVTTFCWFTLWSFVGLLVLPTLSRNASLQIDQLLCKKGTPSDLIFETAYSQDKMQDGEPDRPKLIEAIFHPVPSVSSRNNRAPKSTLGAWNVARTTLFFSWACFGVLSRAVHCNVGRPELWTMLPTD